MKAWRSIFTRFFLYNLKVRHSGVHAVIVHRMPLEPQNPKVIFSQQSSEWRSPSSTNDINVIILALFSWISVQSYLTKVRTPEENVLCREIWQWSRLNSLSEENYKFWEITLKSWWKNTRSNYEILRCFTDSCSSVLLVVTMRKSPKV